MSQPTAEDFAKAKRLVDEKNRAWDERFLAAAQMLAEAHVRLDLIRATKRASSGFVCEPTSTKCDCKPLTGDAFLYYPK